MTINERIRHIRKDKLNMTQTEFAKKLGMKQTSVSSFEKNGATVTEQTKKIICQIFNVSEKYIDDGVGPIFKDIETDTAMLKKILDASDYEIEILKAYFKIDKNIRNELITSFLKFFNKTEILEIWKEAEKSINNINKEKKKTI